MSAKTVNLYKVKLLKETLLHAVLCIDKEMNPQDAVNSCPELAGRWSFVSAAEIKRDKINWHSTDTPKKDRIYPTPCTDHLETHVHILAVR